MRRVAFLVVCVLLIASCGQKAGVHRAISGLSAGTTSGSDTASDTGTDTSTSAGATDTSGSTAATGAGTSAGATTTTAAKKTGTAAVVQPGADRTGITDTTITIGVHAPLTGAAPVKADSFEAGKDLYWNWIDFKGQKIFGRKVVVVFQDDQYSPSTAVAACKQMAEQQHAFLLVGGAGTDQIQACAQYANKKGIPYLSAGVTEAGLTGLPYYFTTSMTYRAQGALLAQLVYKSGKLGDLDKYSPSAGAALAQKDGQVKVAFVRPDTPNFADAEAGLRDGLSAVGKQLTAVEKVPKEDSPNLQSTITQDVSDMIAKGIDVVISVAAPTVTVQLVNAADGQNYAPRYVGPGVTNAINQVLPLVCGKGTSSGFHMAEFYSPWPAWDDVNNRGQFDPDFKPAADKFAPNQNIANGGDLMLSLWGVMKVIAAMFQAAGKDVSRQSFVKTLDSGFTNDPKVFPAVAYSPGQHFGAKTASRLEANCSDQQWHTKDAFVSGY